MTPRKALQGFCVPKQKVRCFQLPNRTFFCFLLFHLGCPRFLLRSPVLDFWKHLPFFVEVVDRFPFILSIFICTFFQSRHQNPFLRSGIDSATRLPFETKNITHLRFRRCVLSTVSRIDVDSSSIRKPHDISRSTTVFDEAGVWRLTKQTTKSTVCQSHGAFRNMHEHALYFLARGYHDMSARGDR